MIELRDVTKFYKTSNGKKYVLNNVSQIIPTNTNVGILGRNGAGKSTLLRMLGGIDFPNSGTIHSDKTFSWPMGLAGGFQGSMTGRQNVKFVCRIYGKSDFQIEEAIEAVKEFSELGDYFDMPIKIYSSGMKSRLSFGLSLFFDFDYLIIDETLSVGDKNFQVKSKAALRKKIENCNVLLVSHAMPILQEICDSGIVVNDAKIEYYEDINEAIEVYDNINKQK
jgi:capsular polysaccharide transport system ATP-binding protein